MHAAAGLVVSWLPAGRCGQPASRSGTGAPPEREIPAASLVVMGAMASVTVFSKPDCHLCVDAMAVLRCLQDELGFALAERDISADRSLHRAYFERIPVVVLDGEELCEYFVDEPLLRERLESRT
jgi:glutaredoxin